ncbi:Bifunctional nuclease family protein [Candidatus Magnetomoraceae bacterium gMMP-15]
MLYEMKVIGFTIDKETNSPVIILKGKHDDQSIPIWIGLLEATSIAAVLQDITFPRPMTHDLFKNFLNYLHIGVGKVEISELKDNTFFSKIYFTTHDHSFSLDSRPSDAIAMALRFKAPIYVHENVIIQANLESTGPKTSNAEVMDESEEGKKWADYLENLSPEDFGKYKI